jgi:hypothetical protein
MEVVIQFLVLLWWYWMLAYYAFGFLQMRQHAAWSIRQARDSVGREARIAEKKKHLERLNEATIRRYPKDRSGDTPIVP